MPVKDSYDLIVIGDQLSGLLLAAGAAARGQRVLVLQESSVPPAQYAEDGSFLGDSLTEPVIGLQEGSQADLFLRSLELYEKLPDLFRRHEPALQVVGEKFRLDLTYEPGGLERETKREFGVSDLHRLLDGSIVQKGSFHDAVTATGVPVDFGFFGWMQATAFGSVASQDLAYPAYKDLIQFASRGVRYPVGGRAALQERLFARIAAFGGTVRRATRVEEIVFERGKLAGVLLSSYEGFVRSRNVVGAMGAKTFLHLVPEALRPSRLLEAVHTLQPRFWRFSFTLVIPERSIPEGIGSHVVVKDGEHFVQLQLFPDDAYPGIPAGHRAVVVRTLVPFVPSSLTAQSRLRHFKRSLAQVEKVFPFLREAPFRLSPDLENGEDPVFLRYQFQSLDHIPPVYLTYENALSGASDQREFLDWSRFGLRGLALCSRDVYPLFGLTGEILAAMDMLALLKSDKKR